MRNDEIVEEKKTLRLVARYGDASNLAAMPTEEGMATLRHKLEVLRGHCETEGRSYDAIEKTAIGPAPMREEHPWGMAPETVPAFLDQLTELGIDQYIFPVVDRAGLNVLLEEIVPAASLSLAAR